MYDLIFKPFAVECVNSLCFEKTQIYMQFNNHFEEHKYDIKNETVFAPLTKGLLGTVNTHKTT